jgi:hypothetical protein
MSFSVGDRKGECREVGPKEISVRKFTCGRFLPGAPHRIPSDRSKESGRTVMASRVVWFGFIATHQLPGVSLRNKSLDKKCAQRTELALCLYN